MRQVTIYLKGEVDLFMTVPCNDDEADLITDLAESKGFVVLNNKAEEPERVIEFLEQMPA